MFICHLARFTFQLQSVWYQFACFRSSASGMDRSAVRSLPKNISVSITPIQTKISIGCPQFRLRRIHCQLHRFLLKLFHLCRQINYYRSALRRKKEISLSFSRRRRLGSLVFESVCIWENLRPKFRISRFDLRVIS